MSKWGKEVEIYGIQDGYRGLITGEYRKMKQEDFFRHSHAGRHHSGHFASAVKKMRVIEEDNVDKVRAMKENFKKMKLDCLVILGGNGTHKTANLLSEEGIPVVTLPKTIDNDVWGTDMTFGFHSAVEIATTVVDCIHTTATSHGRVFIVEIMGHKVGWLPLYAGLAGGADVILLPEIPYKLNSIVKRWSSATRKERTSRFLPWRKAPFPPRRPSFPRKSSSLRELRCNTPPFRTVWPRAGRGNRPGDPRHGARPFPARRQPLRL